MWYLILGLLSIPGFLFLASKFIITRHSDFDDKMVITVISVCLGFVWPVVWFAISCYALLQKFVERHQAQEKIDELHKTKR